jgi:uncharacterized protein YjiS (DUF1127 family)
MYVVSSDRGARPRTTVTGWLLAIGRVLRQRYSAWADTRREAALARALYGASDIELRDMGITRGDIPVIVSRSYRRD